MAEFLLDWAGLAVSLFNTISLAWLGLTILLSGNRRVQGTWLVGGGLLLGAVFFTSHTAILGHGLSNVSLGMDFWWWVSWGPAVVAPLAWYGAMLWHSGFDIRRPHRHRLWLGITSALPFVIVLLLLLANPLPSYHFVAGRNLAPAPAIGGFPLLILVYLLYSILAYLLPIDLFRRSPAGGRSLVAVARRRARPWLIAASSAMLMAGGVMAWTALWVLWARPRPSLTDPTVALAVKRFDLAVAALIAIAITLLGRAIVGYAVFTGRPLPRRGFFRQWRGTVLLAAGLGVITGWALAMQLRPLYSLMLVGATMVIFHALYNWRAFAERAQFMAQMRPFVASLDLYDQLTDSSPPDPSGPQILFETLCREVLGARSGALLPAGALVTLTGPPLLYPPGGADPALQAPELIEQFSSPEKRCVPAAEAGAAWAVSLWNARGLAGVLLLGEKTNGNPYTEEEIDIAQAGGERLLDTLAGAEIARLAMELLRQRIGQVKILQGQARRVLHDEVLPQLHTAILRLNTLEDEPVVKRAVEALMVGHRRVSELMADTPSALSQRLPELGFADLLREFVEREAAGGCDQLLWATTPAAAEAADRLPTHVAEVVLFAAQELVRNAVRHGRGGDPARTLNLSVSLADEPGLRVVVEDDGAGFQPEGRGERRPGEPVAGSGSGLRFHSTMLAAVGASLEVSNLPEGGTRGIITLRPDLADGLR